MDGKFLGKRILVIIMVALLVLTAGCQKKDNTTEKSQEAAGKEEMTSLLKEYNATFEKLSVDSNMDIYHAKQIGAYLYYREFDEDYSVWRIKRMDCVSKKTFLFPLEMQEKAETEQESSTAAEKDKAEAERDSSTGAETETARAELAKTEAEQAKVGAKQTKAGASAEPENAGTDADKENAGKEEADAAEENAGPRWSVACFDVTREGNVLALLGLYEMVDINGGYRAKAYTVVEYDLSGKKVAEQPLEEGAIPNDAFSMTMGVDDGGNICLASNKSLMLIREGGKKGEIPLLDGQYISEFSRSTGGSLFAYVRSGQKGGICRIDFQERVLRELEGIPEGVSCIGEIAGTSNSSGIAGTSDVGLENVLLVGDDERLYCLDVTSGKAYPMLLWETSGLRGYQVQNVSMEGGAIFTVSMAEDMRTTELARLLPMTGEEGAAQGATVKKERETIRLAVFDKTTALSNLVSDYNRSQKNYKVEIEVYRKESGAMTRVDQQNIVNRMMADMLGDNPPDLLNINAFDSFGLEPSWEDLLNKDYVVDLSPYLEQSEKVDKSDFEEKVLELATFQKGIPAIPTAFCLQVILVPRQELAAAKNGWSVSDMIAFDRAHPTLEPYENCTRVTIYSLCVVHNIGHFVDFEGKKAEFDSPEFRELLEYAASYPQGDQAFLYTGNQFLKQQYLQTLYEIQYDRNCYFGKEAEFVGYPSVDGRQLVILQPDADAIALAISQRSTKKEGAWDFVEYALTKNPVTDYKRTYGGIPSNKVILEEIMKELAKEDGPLHSGILMATQDCPKELNGRYPSDEEAEKYYYSPYPFTEEEKEIYYGLLNAAHVEDQRLKKVKDIVWSEVSEYFDGKKGLNQTIEVIQSRVQLYLNEGN